MSEELLVVHAAKKWGIDGETIHRYRKKTPDCPWITPTGKNGKRFIVDDTHPEFLEWIKVKRARGGRKRSEQQKARVRKTVAAPAPTTRPSDPVLDPDTVALQKQSIHAELKKPIVALEASMQKVELGRIKLKREAGENIERAFGDFLYTGYIERINVEHLTYPKKMRGKIKDLVDEEIVHNNPADISAEALADRIVKLATRENESILRRVQEAQQEAVRQWKEENGIE
jgi:hypothetical protein